MKTKRKIIRFSELLIILFLAGACSEDFLEPTVSTAKDINTSINKFEDLEVLMVGAYDRMNELQYYGRNFIVFGEVRSANAFSSGNSGRFVEAGQFTVIPSHANARETWTQIYSVIANANIVIQSEVENNDSKQVKYVKGQAYTVRALAYMDLLQLYGQQYASGNLGVPLIIRFDSKNIYPGRATVQDVYNQIEADLIKAVELMDPSLNKANTKITSWTAYALQSRFYLYTNQHPKVIPAAEKVINESAFAIVDAASFKNSWVGNGVGNTIFQLAFTASDNLVFNSMYFIYNETSYGDVQVTQNLYNIYEATDIRRELFTVQGQKIRMTGKYPSINYLDAVKLIRFEEVVLNYAEALIHLGSPDALTYLNMIPAKRNASLYAEASLDNVILERRKELAMEGFGFIDLVRLEKGIPYVDARQTFSPEGIPFGSPKLAFPIPQNETSANPNIIQNEGY